MRPDTELDTELGDDTSPTPLAPVTGEITVTVRPPFADPTTVFDRDERTVNARRTAVARGSQVMARPSPHTIARALLVGRQDPEISRPEPPTPPRRPARLTPAPIDLDASYEAAMRSLR